MEHPDDACISIGMFVARWGQEHDVSFRSGVQAILCPADIICGVVDPECLVLIDAGADDLESRPIIASEVGGYWIIEFVSEAR